MRAHRLIACIAALCVLTLLRIPLYATPTDTLDTSEPWIATPQAIGEADGDTLRGVVFADANRNGQYDNGEAGVEGVLVSNGRDWTRTTGDGRYEIAIRDDMDLTIVQPRGWRVPTNDRLLPQYFYIHKEGGTGYDLRFGGLPDTGPAPAEVHFPLTRHGAADASFSCAILGDPQTYSNEQIGWLRNSVGASLLAADLSSSDCMIHLGDVVGDDLGLLDRLFEVTATAGAPQWAVLGNHDIDFDARSNADKADSWRRMVGPRNFAFEQGNVLFVGLDNVYYPCTEEAVAAGRCAEGDSYNGRLTETQLTWLAGLLDRTPDDRLIVLAHHIPFVSFVDAESTTHQTDNVTRIYELLEGRTALSLSGHTHTLENHAPGQVFAGWSDAVGVEALPFRHIIAGAASGAWFQGDFNTFGVPMALQRMGAPQGYLHLDIDSTRYQERYVGARLSPERNQWVGLNTPGFRDWFNAIMAWREAPADERDPVPPRSINDLPDPHLLTPADFEEGVWLTANVWAGSAETTVEAKLPGGEVLTLERTQQGTGEAPRTGTMWADPFATARQLSVARFAYESRSGDARAQGFELFGGRSYGPSAPRPQNHIATRNMHLWRAQLPALPVGVHVIRITSTDRHGRAFTDAMTIEVREERPPRYWREAPWRDE